jgi:chromosome partitioning protein
MKVITVTNRKGGVGKSTMSVHIAAGLATRGYRVGLIDTDSQGHAGLMLNMPEENGLYNVLLGKETLESVVREVPAHHYSHLDMSAQGALYLIPSSHQTYKIPYELEQTEVFAVMKMVEAFAEIYSLDVIIIDTNPTMSLFDAHIFMATDAFIYVTECERLSFDGIQKAAAQIARLSRDRQRFLGRGSEIIGIIPNKLKSKTSLHEYNIGQLQAAYGALVWDTIAHRITWAEATNYNVPVFVYAPTGKEAKQAWNLVKRVEEVLEYGKKELQ